MTQEFEPGDIIQINEEAKFLYSIPVDCYLKVISVHGEDVEVEHLQSRNLRSIYGVFSIIASTAELVKKHTK